MPIEINVGQVLAGYNLKTVKEGEEATVVVREFVSSDEAALFENRIKGIPQILLSKIPADKAAELRPVTSMLAILRKDESATLYLDCVPTDPQPTLRVRPKGNVNSGEAVETDEIADIVKVEYPGVTFPADAGIVVLFVMGERRGFFYDLAPLTGDKKSRDFDVEKSLASFFAYLHQTHLFELDEDDWKYLFDNQWFPFVTLNAETSKQLCERAKTRQPLDDLLGDVVSAIKSSEQRLREKIRTHSVFAYHSQLLEHALDRFLEGDYLSSTSILYPRTEGVLRSIYGLSGNTNKPGQSSLAAATIQARGNQETSGILLLPDRFLDYLKQVYFAGFDPSLAGLDPNSPASVSRNSVGHGVAPQSYFNEKSAAIALLILDQISYFLPDESAST